MTTLHQSFRVAFDYPVIFTRAVFDPANPALAKALARTGEPRRNRVLAAADDGLLAAWPDLEARIAAYADRHAARLELAGPLLRVRGGEAAKRGGEAARVLVDAMLARRLDRHGVVLAIGGGGVLDTVGFAASLVHRGLRLVRVPTTVVAQNDVGVGVKTGLDLGGVKNAVGTFAPPFAVLVDFDFLATLPDREWIAGAAEAFKVALLKDATFFRFLCRHAAALRRRDDAAMARLVRRCAELHLRHIGRGGDPFEMGSARPLDFGHWSAHWLETRSDYALSHGEAVAVGIALDALYAVDAGLLSAAAGNALLRGLTACGLAVWHPLLDERRGDGARAVLDGLESFREHLGGELTITLPSGVGRRVEVHTMAPARIDAACARLRAEAPPVKRGHAGAKPRPDRGRPAPLP